MSENLERMIQLANDIFAMQDDPEQINVNEEVIKQLQRIHPDTLSEYDDGDGPLVWILLIPTTVELMYQFINKEISETDLLNKTPLNIKYETLYLCSALVLPEFRRRGLAKQVACKAIKSIRKTNALHTLFTWNFTDEGAILAERIAYHESLPLLKRVRTL